MLYCTSLFLPLKSVKTRWNLWFSMIMMETIITCLIEATLTPQTCRAKNPLQLTFIFNWHFKFGSYGLWNPIFDELRTEYSRRHIAWRSMAINWGTNSTKTWDWENSDSLLVNFLRNKLKDLRGTECSCALCR